MRKDSNPIVHCVRCLYSVGFGFTTIEKITHTNKGLCGRWVIKAGIHKGDRSKTFSKKHRHFDTPNKRQRFDCESIIIDEYKREQRAANKSDEFWLGHRVLKRWRERTRRNTDPKFRAMFYARKRVKNFLTQRGMSTKAFSATRAIGCTPDQLRAWFEQRFSKAMSWANHGTYWAIDHVIPLASASTVADVRRLSHYTNLQPLTCLDNIRKGDKTMKQESLPICAI